MTTPRFSDEPSSVEIDCLDLLEIEGECPDIWTVLALREGFRIQPDGEVEEPGS